MADKIISIKADKTRALGGVLWPCPICLSKNVWLEKNMVSGEYRIICRKCKTRSSRWSADLDEIKETWKRASIEAYWQDLMSLHATIKCEDPNAYEKFQKLIEQTELED